MIRDCSILCKRHRNRVLADVINCSSSQRASIMVSSSPIIQAATLRNLEKWVAWTNSNFVVAAVLLVDTINIIWHKR